MDEEARKARVRVAFPVSTDIAGQWRAIFGDGVQLKFAEEGGLRIGRPLDESKHKVIYGAEMILDVKQKGGARGR